MSAREKLLAAFSHTADYHLDYTYPGLSNEEIADQLLSEHAHELAAKIREHITGVITEHGIGYSDEGWFDAADLIDPESEAT